MTGHLLRIDALLALEHRGWEALTRHEGGSFYGELMTADALMILVNGMVLDRETIAATLNESPAWSTFSLEDARLVPTGEESAALVYRATASRDGQDEPFVALMSSHYTLAGRQARAHSLPADHRDPLTGEAVSPAPALGGGRQRLAGSIDLGPIGWSWQRVR